MRPKSKIHVVHMAASCNQIFSNRPPSTASIWPVT